MAKAALKKALRLEPLNYAAYLCFGTLHRRTGNFDAAQSCYEMAQTAFKDKASPKFQSENQFYVHLYNDMANLYVELRNYEQGLEYFKKSIKCCEESKEADIAMINDNSDKQVIEKAKKENEEFWNQEIARRYRNMGVTYSRMGNKIKSGESYRKSLEYEYNERAHYYANSR